MLGDDRGGDLAGTGATFEARLVGGRERAVDAELHERLRRLDRLDEQLGVVAPHVGGIATEREVGDLELDVVALLPLVPALGRALAGGVGVVGEDHLAGEVLDDLEVVVGERGAAGRHRVRLTGERERHHVGVALADEDLPAGHDLGLRPVEPVQQAALLVDRGLG